MRIMWRGWGLGALIAAGLVLSNGMPATAGDAPVVHVKAEVKDGAVSLHAEANAPFEYTTYRPSASLYVLDLSGVSAGDAAGARIVPSDLVKSYRVTTYSSGDKPVARVEILMAQGVDPRLERNGSEDLTLLVSRTSSGAASAPGASPAIAPVVAKPADVPRANGVSPSIRQIHLTEDAGRTEVNISGSGALTYHAMRLHNPDRLVLDFRNARLETSENHLASNLDPVREIRVAQFTPEVSRVVIDLRQPAAYNIAQVGDTVSVSFSPKGVPSGAAQRDSSDQSADVVTIKAPAPSNPAAFEHETSATKQGEVPAPAAVLPVALTGTSAALATPSPDARAASSKPADEPVATAAPAAQPGATPVAGTAGAAQAPAAAPAPAKFSGEPISVNLKDVDLRDFFRLIHEISGLNVVLDPNVKGTLTIVLDDVPWDQALDIVLKNNDLDKQLDGNVLRIATRATLQKEAEESRDLVKAQAEAADVVTTTRVLSYAKATDLATTLKKFLSSRGDVIADDRSNTLIIRDIPSTLPVLDNLIRQLDRKSQQVEIEARVVEASRSFSREIGSQFGISAAGGNPTSFLSGASSVGTSPIIHFPPIPPVIVSTGSTTGTAPTQGSIPLNSNLPVGAPTSGFSYSFGTNNFALDLIITAAEEKGVGKLLSKPKVVTQNNQKATVKQGVKIPVQTIVNNTVSVQFVDAVLELDVTPQITADGTIYMDVTVENDQIDQSIPRVEGIPAIDTQSAETKITVDDGATVVIGGVILTTQSTNIQQVPLFGSVPVIGNLFKHTTVSSTSSELLFFLTPRILPS